MYAVNADRLKSLCRFLSETGADEEGLRLFHSAIVNDPEAKSRRNHARLPKTKIQLRTDAIVEKTWQVASAGKVSPGHYDLLSGQYKPVPQVSGAIKGPPEEYTWTKGLPGYEAAFDSAARAIHRLWAATQAAAAGFNSKNPELDVLLFQIRAGRIEKGDPRIQKAINLSDKCGYSGNTRDRIAEEFHNREKRVSKDYCDVEIGDSFFYDLNPFRVILPALWVGSLFWLMPDRLIADFLLSKRAVPPTTRQAVSQAVLQMGLTKHEPPLVKSIEHGFKLCFVEGYPPKS